MYISIEEGNVFFVVADSVKTDESKVKITRNEACTLQNQVRQEMEEYN
jgi:hypothetical protein